GESITDIMTPGKINCIVDDQLRSDIAKFKAVDQVQVHVRIFEVDVRRIKLSDDIGIERRSDGISETLTVRKISYGVGVERTFPIHTPKNEKIEVSRRRRVRRAKLYYLRNLRGKAARIREIR